MVSNNLKVKSGSVTNFPIIGFKVVYKDTISFSIEKVFPLFEPEDRTPLYENWKPTVLREGQNGSLKGKAGFQNMI